MFSVRWSPDYAVGIAEVDAQHHALIDMINALSSGIGTEQEDTNTRMMLDRLADYTRFHFSTEEQLMEKQPLDPDFKARHRGEHAYFIGVLRDFTRDFENGRSKISAPLVEYLVHWLLHHIVVTDREMGKLLNSPDPYVNVDMATHQTHDTTAELNASERHLLAEMQRCISDLRSQLEECANELAATRAKLQDAELRLAERQ